MDQKWLAGVDIGGTTIKMAFVSLQGDIVDKWEIYTNKSENGKHIPTEIARSIENKLSEQHKTKEILAGLGVGAPGPINDEDGSVAVGVNIGWEKNFPLKAKLEQELSLPVIVDNDANVAAIGEMWKGAGERAKDVLCVTLGTGVGGGVIANGEVLHGVNGAAGEIGHITVVVDDGAPCNCGKKGCLETVASATGVVRFAKEMLKTSEQESKLRSMDIDRLTAKDIFDLAKEMDPLANEIVKRITHYLGLALANASNVINPKKIVIGGGVSKAGNILLNPLKEEFQKFAFPRVSEGAELTIAKLENDAGVIGAAWLAKTEAGY